MDISLPPELEEFIRARVASGEYKDAAEVIDEAVRNLVRKDAAYDEWIRTEVMKGIEAADRGELEDFDMDAITAEVLAEELARVR